MQIRSRTQLRSYLQTRSSFHYGSVFGFLLLLAVGLLFTPIASAQFRASIQGVVTDPSGAVVPGATVTLTNKETNQTQTTTTNASGAYTFNALPPSHFSMTVTAPGFQKKVISTVAVIPEQANALNIQLALGQSSQTVTVSGSEVPALDTENATVSATITSNQIQHLPSFNRDVFQLAQLTPGVFGDASQASGGGSYNLPGNQGPGGTAGGAGGIFETENGPQVQTRGGQYETNGISIDGISTTSAVWGGTSIITPSEDSVADLKVVSNDYNAEYGRFSGGQLEVTTKSGTNHLHGSAFFKASRPGLNAYQRWNGVGSNHSGSAASRGVNRDTHRFNQYGGSLGGPLWRDHLFAFFAFETSPLDATNTAENWYETSEFDHSAAASGSIAAKYLSYPGEAVSSSSMIPRTCASVGLTEGVDCATTSGGLDVGSPITSGLGYQDLTYGGNTGAPGVGGGLDGVPDLAYFTTVDPTTTSQSQWSGRLDAQVTRNDRLSFTIYWVPVSTTNYNGPVRSANLWHHSQVNAAYALIWIHTFSPTLINEARANAAGWRWNEVTSNPQEPFGLPQDNIDNIGSATPQFFGAPGPSNLNQWTYTYRDVLTKVAGRNNIKMGGELTRLYYLNNPVYNARPSFNFHNLWDFANDAPYLENGHFDHVTGVPADNRQDNRSDVWGAFVQDDYKVLPNLTLNLGLRWSYFGAFYSKENNLDVLQLGTGANTLTGMNIRVGGGLYTPQKNNWGPQFGFAWQPVSSKGNLVVRGGFGINYNQNEIAITANGNGNPPNVIQANYNCTYPYTTNPTCSGTGILYETAGDIHSVFGYAPNPATITAFGSNNLPLPGSKPAFVTGFPLHPKTISNYHFSLDTEYQMPFNMVASLGYQGSLMRHLLIQYEWNSVAAVYGIPLNPEANFVDFYDNAASGNYNAMIATLTHTFSHGFQAEAQYTWGKAMDENSGPYFEDPYPFNHHLAYGRANYNVANAFKLFGLWQPVFFHGHNFAEKVLGGWSLGGIWNLHSGFPWSPYYNTQGNIYFAGSPYGQLRPAARLAGYGTSTSNSVFKVSPSPNFGGDATKFFTPPAYTPGPAFPAEGPAPQLGIERNSLNGPGYNDVDATLTKAFGLPNNRILGENAKFEIRADAYNLFNKTNINVSSIDSRVGSVAPDGTVSPNSNFGVAGSALGSRTVQLQARFSF